ncbi:MAG: 3'-5' exonuclease [Acidimicrobiales bacterium]
MDESASMQPGFAVVDVETTGFSAAYHRIVEVAVVLTDPAGAEIEAFCTLVDPGRDPGPTHVHGITAAMVEGAPTFGHIHPYLANLLSGRVLVGHNVGGFDLDFLRAECRRHGGDAMLPSDVPLVDTLVTARDRLDLYGRARLVDCCDYFELTWDDHHSALGDARVTVALFAAMREKLGDESMGIVGLMARAGGVRWPGAADVRPLVRGRQTSEVPGVPSAVPGVPSFVATRSEGSPV